MKVVKEPPDMYANTGVYEKCHFCAKPTDTWHQKTNTPICEGCAKKHKTLELKGNNLNK